MSKFLLTPLTPQPCSAIAATRRRWGGEPGKNLILIFKSKSMNKHLLLVALFLNIWCMSTAQVDFMWGKQIGTEKDEKTRNLNIDTSGNIYLVGKTKGAIGKENFGKNDAFIIKVDSSANAVWSIQIGSSGDDELSHVAVDESGNIYAVGFIGVRESAVNQDILVVKISNEGEMVWQKQFGTDSTDLGSNIIVDPQGDIYVCGYTEGVIGHDSKGKSDCFIIHLDSEGNRLGTVQFGSSDKDMALGLTISHNSDIYVSGSTEGDLAAENAGKMDLFWGVFTMDLKQKSMKQFGTPENDYAGEIKIDLKNNVYLAGGTYGNAVIQNSGSSDAFLQKWNDKGEIEWMEQFGTSNWDGIHSICIVGQEGIIISGCYDYPLCKSFVKMYDTKGALLWDRNIIAQGKSGGSCGKDICMDHNGNIYHTGYTGANLFSELNGEHDLFLVRYQLAIKELHR